MGLLGKNTYKRSFFYAKYQKYNQKVVSFVFFNVNFAPCIIKNVRNIFMSTTIDNRTLTQTSVNEHE